MSRWDWAREGAVDSTTFRLGDHAAARYRRFRRTVEAIPRVNETLFGLLLTVESAREELQPFESASSIVQLAGTRTAVQQLERLHRVLDEAVAMTNGILASMDEAEWAGALQDERSARVEWYRVMVEEGGFEDEAPTWAQQEEVLTLLKAAMNGDEVKRELIPGERELMETVFDRLVHTSGMVVVSIPEWFTMPLSSASSYGLSSWGSQRLEVNSIGDPSAHVLRSASIWSTLNHPHIAKFLGACHIGSRPFLLHEGTRPLIAAVTFQKQFPPRKLLWTRFYEVALGLRYLSSRGLAVANLVTKDMWIARFEGKAVVGCGDVVYSSHRVDMRSFATSILAMWRKVDA